MGIGINNPVPSSLSSECKKCAKILTAFVDPRRTLGQDKVIPPAILRQAKGLAILTVIKAGFLGSARFGSGLVIARLPRTDENGASEWSAPAAIATGGAGFGGQIGFEITDFVFILNDASAVKTFAQAGSLTLGGNVSLAAGPVGRSAEAAGAASLRSVAGIFAYSSTKGLFAGVSLEGSAIIERKDANTKMYGRPIAASQLLLGDEPTPAAAEPLLHILRSAAFNSRSAMGGGDSIYNDAPVMAEHIDPVVTGQQREHQSYQPGHGRNATYGGNGGGSGAAEFGGPKRASTWQDDVYDAPPRQQQFGTGSRSNTFQQQDEKRAGPGRPAAPKPKFQSKQNIVKKNQAVAQFKFTAEQPGDLSFVKGDVITVLKKTDNETDWWTGMIGARHGQFPSNYVKMLD